MLQLQTQVGEAWWEVEGFSFISTMISQELLLPFSSVQLNSQEKIEVLFENSMVDL